MPSHHTHSGKSETALRRIDAVEAVRQLAAKQYGGAAAHVRAVLTTWRVGLALVTVLAVLVELGAWKPGGWTGYYAELQRRCKLSDRQLRRSMKALRALGFVDGEPPPAEQDDEGRWTRGKGTYRVRLPRWIASASWSRRPKQHVTPTGHERPDTRVISKSSSVLPSGDVQNIAPRARAPVDNDDWRAGRPMPADARAAIDQLIARKGRGPRR